MPKFLMSHTLKWNAGLFGLILLSFLGLFLIIQNADYSRGANELSYTDTPNVDQIDLIDDWKLIALKYDYQTPKFFHLKSLKRVESVVAFWRKPIYENPGSTSLFSHHTGTFDYEAPEYYQVDCERKRLKGPLRGLYWKIGGNAFLESNRQQKQWFFIGQWNSENDLKAGIDLWDLCNNTNQQGILAP